MCVTKLGKRDKIEYMEGLAQAAEDAACYGDSHSLYATIKTLSGNFVKPEVPVKDLGRKFQFMGKESNRNF